MRCYSTCSYSTCAVPRGHHSSVSPHLHSADLNARVQELYSTLCFCLASPDPHLSANSLCFPLKHFSAHTVSDAFRDANGRDHLVIDLHQKGRVGQWIVPVRPLIPYPGAQKRQRERLEAADILPLFFVNADPSVSFAPADAPSGIPEDKMLTRSIRTSLKIHFAVRISVLYFAAAGSAMPILSILD
jgi:hypothetical protein